MSNKSVLLPPGMGDIHWVMTKLRSYSESLDRDLNLYVWDPGDGRRRVDGYMSAIANPRLHWMGYLELPLKGETRKVWNALYVEGSQVAVRDALGCDFVMGFNAQLEQGKDLASILGHEDTEWDYPLIEEPCHAAAVRDKFGFGAGQYVVYQWHGIGSYLRDWFPHFDRADMVRVMSETYKKSGFEAVMVGLGWDQQLAKELSEILGHPPWLHNLTCRTSTGQLFALQRRAAAHVGFASGGGIMATHLRTPTIMLWAERWTRGFADCWAPPGFESWYKPLFVEDKPDVVQAIQEML